MEEANYQATLRTGRDPNDATWVIVRYGKDWAKGQLKQLIFDSARGVVELEPSSGISDKWLPLEPVTDREGNQFRSDPANHRILRRKCGEREFKPVDCIGGLGWETGRLDTPLGLSVDSRDWLYVADAGNHRVQIVRPDDGSVVAVLGATDQWGRPATGAAMGAMTEPVHAVADSRSCRVYVADRAAGLIHVFDERFLYLRSFEPRTIEPGTLPQRASGLRPRPAAVAVLKDGSILVLDATRPRLAHMTAEGRPLPDVAVHSVVNPFSGGKPLKPFFRPDGEAILGPLDGGSYDQKWHRIIVEADVAAGTSISVQTYASNDSSELSESLPWAPNEPVKIPLETVEGTSGEFQRLVLSDVQRWRRSRYGPFERDMPVVHEFSGNGPSSSDSFLIPGSKSDVLRAGDKVEFEKDGAKEQIRVKLVAANHQVEFTATGNARIYGPGSQVRLVERAGRPVPGKPRLLYELPNTESLDLSAASTDGKRNQSNMPHAVAAFFRPDDSIEVAEGEERLRLYVERINKVDAQVTLAEPVAGDFSTSTFRLIDTPGRLLVKELVGFQIHPALHESITVENKDGSEKANISLAETDRRAVWLEPGSLGTHVLFEDWKRFETEAGNSTDCGRYLWIRLHLVGREERSGDASAVRTPSIHSVRALMPRSSYLSYLPAVYSRRDPRNEPSGALFLERFLALFEEKLTDVEAVYESVSRLLNPRASDPQWLAFLSTWLGLVFDPSWPLERRRQLVLEAADLYKRRGTPECIRRYVEIYTGRRPELVEGFQGRTSMSLILGRSGRVGCSTVGGDPCDYRKHANRFKLYVFLDDSCDFESAGSSLQNLVESIKPAHAEFELCFLTGQSTVGLQSRVGVDMVLGTHTRAPSILGSGTRLSNPERETPLQLDTVPGAKPLASDPRGLRLSHGGVRCDQGFNLK